MLILFCNFFKQTNGDNFFLNVDIVIPQTPINRLNNLISYLKVFELELV